MLEGVRGSERSHQEVLTEAGSEEPQPRGAGLAEGGTNVAPGGGGGRQRRSIFPGKQTLENWMIPCISSQPYDLITRKCHMHLSVQTDVWKERQAGLIFFLLVYEFH